MATRSAWILIITLCWTVSFRVSASSVQPAVAGRFDGALAPDSSSGKVPIQVRELRVALEGPYGKLVAHRILILFAPGSGTFSWSVNPEDSSSTDSSRQSRALQNERAVFVKDHRIFVFSAGAGTLYIQDRCDHASTMDEAETKALTAAAGDNSPAGSLDTIRYTEGQWRTVTLDGLSHDFLSEPFSAAVPAAAKVIRVQWNGTHWKVDLKARWIEELTLDSDFKVISMRKIELDE